jgi:LacI family transcriptional regulator
VLTADIIAYGLYQAAQESGINIPDSLSIFGNDDLDFSRILNPGLTTTLQPKKQAGRIAARLLINKMNNIYSVTRRIVMKPHIVIRGSVKSIK